MGPGIYMGPAFIWENTACYSNESIGILGKQSYLQDEIMWSSMNNLIFLWCSYLVSLINPLPFELKVYQW